MAVTDLYPNSANCGGWLNSEVSPLPNTLAAWTAGGALSDAQRNTLSTLAGTVSPTPGPYCGICIKIRSPSASPSQIDLTVDMEDNGGESTALYAYNANTSTFVSQDTHAGDAPGTYQLTASITSSPEDYVDGSDDIYLLIANTTGGGDTAETAQVLCSVTTGAVALAGTIAAAAGASGALSVAWALAGPIAAQSGGSGILGIPRALAGTMAAQSGATAALTVTTDPIPIAGSLVALSLMTGTLSVTRGIAGSIAGQAGVAGILTVTGPSPDVSGIILGMEF